MGKFLKLQLGFACVLGIANFAEADTNTKYGYGQLNCSFNQDSSTGRSVEMYGETDSLTNNTTIGFKYVIEFKKPTNIDPCGAISSNIYKQAQLDLKRKEIELKELEARLNKRIQDLESENTTQDKSDDFEGDW